MAASPVAVIDVLNSLLDAELNSIFRFMGEGSPYLSRASGEVRRPLHDMLLASNGRAAELAAAIDRLGGVPDSKGIEPEEQYLAFLTIKFLLPKLVDAKKLIIERYDNALRTLADSSAETVQLLNNLRGSHQAELKTLEHAADLVMTAKA